jgi:predicted RND superfamily exporter protein
VKRLMRWIVIHPVIGWVIILIVTAVFSLGLGRVTSDSSANGLFIKGNQNVLDYYQAKEVFGEDVILTIVIKAADVFQAEILETVIQMTYEAEGLDGVFRVVSLATASDLDGSSGILNTASLLPYVPDTPEELAELRTRALNSEIYRGELLNARGTATAIHLFVEDRPEHQGFNERLVAAVQEMIDQAEARLGPDVSIYQFGSPFLKTNILDSIRRNVLILTPAALLAIFLVLLMFFRTARAVVIPLVTGLLSVVWTVGFMGLFGFAVNPVSVMIPPLLIVVGCTEDIHLLAEYGAALRAGLDRNSAILQMAERGGLAILLTCLTTFVGFVTLVPNSIPMLREFGIAVSFGIAANFLITIILVPGMLRWFRPYVPAIKRGKGLLQMEESVVVQSGLRHRQAILVGLLAFILVAVGLSSLVHVDTDYLRFFKEESEIRRNYQSLSKDLVGGTNIMVILSADEPGAMQSPRILETVVRLSDFMAGQYDKVLGYSDFLRKIHQEMNGGDPAYFVLPSSRELISQYTLLMNQDDLTRFVDYDYRSTCILVRADLSGSSVINAEVAKIQHFIDTELTKDLHYTITGEPVIVSGTSDTISRELIVNLGNVLCAILLFISILFMSLKAGVLAMVPNIVPIVATFAAMGLMGIPLSTSTFPVAIIALGIAVDDTIHLMVRYSKEIKLQDSNTTAMIRTIHQELQPVMSTSLALMVGFMVFLLSQFGATVEFGLLATIALGTALLSDLFITPSLLLTTPLITSWDYIKLKVSGDLAETSPMLRGLSLREIKRVAAMAAIREFSSGEMILREGEEGRDMFVLLSGSATVRSRKTGKVLSAVQRGDVVGEMAFLTGAHRSADVVAMGEVEALEINAATLDRLRMRFLGVAVKVFYNISRLLSDRLRETTTSLVDERSGES